ncbi:hypothetical protein C8Q79DRAFT_1074565, partial [Trametes meyenii]
MIARYRRNYCVAHVNGHGQGYLRANAILFEQPTLRVYDVLPPPREDMAECFALIFTGSASPSNEDYKRTPFVVRHRVVMRALKWLKLNNHLYSSVQISESNMKQYQDDHPPVYVLHRNLDPSDDLEPNVGVHESATVFNHEDANDTRLTECPFMIHTISAAELGEMTYQQRLAYAVRYFQQGGSALGVGHDPQPQSIYNNENLYPGMYPWLYPYGIGGFENSKRKRRLDRLTHVRANLRMGGARFQTDR